MSIQKYILLIVLFVGFIGIKSGFSASNMPQKTSSFQAHTQNINPQKEHPSFKEKIVQAIPFKDKRDSDLVLSLICCFFLGNWGLHRIVMGGSPWLILWYTITLGGFFGVLPFLDFIRMALEPEHYQNNNKFFAAFGAM